MGSSLDQGHCIVFLGNTLNSHSTSLRPTVQMDNDKFNDGGKPAMDYRPTQGDSQGDSQGDTQGDYRPTQWGVEIFLATWVVWRCNLFYDVMYSIYM